LETGGIGVPLYDVQQDGIDFNRILPLLGNPPKYTHRTVVWAMLSQKLDPQSITEFDTNAS